MLHEKLIVRHDPQSPAAERYRILRTNIQFMNAGNHIKIILITSPGVREGKSFITSNLAACMAMNGQRVIVIDANLRNPALHNIFGIGLVPGITEILCGRTELSSALQETGMENLSILTAGQLPPNPAEMIASTGMKQLIPEAGRLADAVLIDSPPLLPVADGALLAAAVDGVIMVLSGHLTGKEQAIKAKRIINNARARLIGLILNRCSSEPGRLIIK